MRFLAALGFSFIFAAAVSCAPATKDQSRNVYFLIPDPKATFIKAAQVAGTSFPAHPPTASLIDDEKPSFQQPDSFLQHPAQLQVHIAEPVAADARLSKVPLLLVPESFLQVREPADHHVQPFIAEVSSSEAVPNLSTPLVVPSLPLSAVPVQLKDPIRITSPQALVSFPSAFSVHQPGQTGAVPMHVEAVLVPTPENIEQVSPSSPVLVNLVLAVTAAPGQTVSIQIDVKPEQTSKPAEGGESYPAVSAGAPATEETTTTTATTTTTTEPSTTTTYSTTTESSASSGEGGAIEIEVNQNPASEIDEELENREPPATVDKPQMVLLGFFNSKDTPHLLHAIQQAILRL